MGANVTIYCLEKLTDYSEFERLSTDLMAQEGYSSIEPLGGFSDKGRDAIHVDKSGVTTIFAYSVRENWRVKLAEDANKIRHHEHTCDELIFVTTSDFSATERDEAITYIQREFGWKLKLYGLERLRVLLEVSHPQIIQNHPQIFNPSLYSEHKIAAERKNIFISYVEQDWGLADWLTRKLTAEGYSIWCERFELLGGEHYPENIDNAITNLAFRMIALYSKASLKNQEVMRQRHLALSVGKQQGVDFLVPLNVDKVNIKHLDRETSLLVFIPFFDSWAEGLAQLLNKLEKINCPKTSIDGRRIAATDYLGKDVLSEQPEKVFSNYFLIERFPRYIYVFEAEKPIKYDDKIEVSLNWAYKKVGSRFYLGFHEPPAEIKQKFAITDIDSIEWQGKEIVNKINTQDLLSELVRKSLIVKCQQKGLQYCSASEMQYFPAGLVENDSLKILRPDGSRTHVNSVGQRTYFTLHGAEVYCYALSPVFNVVQDVFDNHVLQIGVRVRLTDQNGKLLPRRKINSRRKHLCKDWWNHEWFNRMLAICQYLADDGRIMIENGGEENEILIAASPFYLTTTVGIDEMMLDRIMESRKRVKAALGLSSADDEFELNGEAHDE